MTTWRFGRTALVGASTLVVVAATTRAWASAPFPDEVASHVGATAAPPCSVCHVDGVTGTGTAETLLARSLRDRGLVSGDVEALRAALDASAEDQVDSDDDGSTDVDELREETDPNVAGATMSTAPVPEYGCGASVADATGVSGGSVPLVLLLLATFAIRLRRR